MQPTHEAAPATRGYDRRLFESLTRLDSNHCANQSLLLTAAEMLPGDDPFRAVLLRWAEHQGAIARSLGTIARRYETAEFPDITKENGWLFDDPQDKGKK